MKEFNPNTDRDTVAMFLAFVTYTLETKDVDELIYLLTDVYDARSKYARTKEETA